MLSRVTNSVGGRNGGGFIHFFLGFWLLNTQPLPCHLALREGRERRGKRRPPASGRGRSGGLYTLRQDRVWPRFPREETVAASGPSRAPTMTLGAAASGSGGPGLPGPLGRGPGSEGQPLPDQVKGLGGGSGSGSPFKAPEPGTRKSPSQPGRALLEGELAPLSLLEAEGGFSALAQGSPSKLSEDDKEAVALTWTFQAPSHVLLLHLFPPSRGPGPSREPPRSGWAAGA